MADIIPFRGLCYNREKIKDVSSVLAPPYDVISPEDEAELREKSPYNIVRLILSRDEDGKDRYTLASETLEHWIDAGILCKDDSPSIYLYEQGYRFHGEERKRRGFIALMRLEEYGGNVIPHERTLLAPKEDRLRLLSACKANLSPVFGLYSDPSQRIDAMLEEETRSVPVIDITDDDGIRNRLWRIENREKIDAITSSMKESFVFIADGHHRYETALAYRDMMRERVKDYTGDEPFNYVMTYLANMDERNLTVLPTHRLLHGIPRFKPRAFLVGAVEFFLVEEVRFNDSIEPEIRKAFFNRLEERGREAPAFGVFINGMDSYFVLTVKDMDMIDTILGEGVPEEVKRLDLTILHSFMINSILGISEEDEARQRHIDYVKDRDEAISLVRSNRYQMAFLLNPPDIRKIVAAARTGARMPQKSTYFYPKLLTGLVINRIDDP